MKLLEKNKGITLVALVVTIIVLIILAGVSVSLVLGQDGVVQKAKQGRDNYAEAARLENEQLANVDAFSIGIGDTIEPKADGMITNMTGGDLDISATVSLTSQGRTEIDFENTKYVFKTSSDPLGVTDSSLYSDGTITEANTTIKKAKVAGTYYLHVLLAEKNGNKQEIISETGVTSAGKKDFDYTGNIEDITLLPGNYKLEVWGAQGGENTYGGKGAYVSGNYVVSSTNKTLYVVVGGQGSGNTQGSSESNKGLGGYNGGGFAPGYASSSEYGQNFGGGGATHIAEVSGLLASLSSATNKEKVLMVAGGGGGGMRMFTTSWVSYFNSANGQQGPYGGYASGTGTAGSGNNWCCGGYGGGATQSSGGSGGSAGSSTNSAGTSGTFGAGGNGSRSSSYYSGSGGGGGWYGGGGSGGGCGGSTGGGRK